MIPRLPTQTAPLAGVLGGILAPDLGGQVASRLPSSNTSLLCPVPVSKGQGGAQQCFVFLYKTNDVSQTHEPHHTSPITTTVNTNTNSSNVTTKYDCGAHALPTSMPMQRDAGAGHQLSPDLRKPPLLFVCICSRPGALLSDLYSVPRLTQPQGSQFPRSSSGSNPQGPQICTGGTPTAGALLQKQSYQTMTPTPVDDAPSLGWSHEPAKQSR